MPKWAKALIISFLVVSITGCKITATNRDKDSDSDQDISGRFYDTRDTGRHYPTESWAVKLPLYCLSGGYALFRDQQRTGAGVWVFGL